MKTTIAADATCNVIVDVTTITTTYTESKQMQKAITDAYELGVKDTFNGVTELIRDIVKKNTDIDNLPSRLVLQVLLASIISMEKDTIIVEDETNADVSADSDSEL